MNALNQKELGLYQKFSVARTDGQDAPGQRHHGDEYFVLNLTTDKHAIPALAAYAESCAADYPRLAEDLRVKIAENISAASLYITVPEITLPSGLVVPSFRVAKYAMSRGVCDIAISSNAEKPWINISYDESRRACEAAGGMLITETQALAIAYDISQQAINWTGGKVGEGKIYQGIHQGSVNEAMAGNYEPNDSEDRRWHVLSNGESIHDFAGNVYTWIFDDVQGNEKGLTSKIAADSISLTTAPFPSQEKGMGWRPSCACNWSGRALVRGGDWCSESYAGVFVLRYGDPVDRYVDVGFRCTKGL